MLNIRWALPFLCALALFAAAPAEALPAPPAPPHWQTNGCTHGHPRQAAKRGVRAIALSRRTLTRSRRHRIRHFVVCVGSPKTESDMRRYRTRMLVKRRRDAAVRRLLPYRCGSHGRWAIPCSIIACESGFSWSAYNPSGAAGPYQLLGHGAPMPATTADRRMRHHRIAAALWAGGRGRSHWVC